MVMWFVWPQSSIDGGLFSSFGAAAVLLVWQDRGGDGYGDCEPLQKRNTYDNTYNLGNYW